MIKAEKILGNFTKADSAVFSAANEEFAVGVTEKNSADVSNSENAKNEDLEKKSAVQSVSIQSADVADDVPIYTATAKEIHYWHACVNIHILDFLRTYDLDRQSLAFDSFRIGVDEKSHAITFSLDDTHYLKIDLNDTNVRPLDKEQAEKVLRKVNAMRFEKVKDHPFYRPRTW